MTSRIRWAALAASAALLVPTSATARPAAEPAPAPVAVHLEGLPRGDAPAIAFTRARGATFLEAKRWTLHRPDGTTLRLPRMTWTEWEALGRGAVAMTGTEAGPLLQVVNRHAHVDRSEHVDRFGLSVSPDRTIVGWLGNDHSPTGTSLDGRFTLPAVPHARTLDAVLGTRTCQEAYPEGGGCSAFATVRRHHADHAWVTTSHGIVTRIGHVDSVVDASMRGTLLARDGSCWAFVRRSGSQAWRTCATRLRSLAPDARHLLGTGPGRPWVPQHRAVVLSTSGTVVQTFTLAGRGNGFEQIVWEDATHLLALAHEGSGYALVRLGLDGSVSRATQVVNNADGYRPFGLPVR